MKIQQIWQATWTRSLIVHPAILVVPALVVCALASLFGNNERDAGLAFVLAALTPVLTFGLTIGLAISRRLPLIEGVSIVIVSTVVAIAASVVVFELWFAVAQDLCHGRSDCPL